jgi:hypothetical protein
MTVGWYLADFAIFGSMVDEFYAELQKKKKREKKKDNTAYATSIYILKYRRRDRSNFNSLARRFCRVPLLKIPR